jgi:fucose 4-O-acetylase-like acetyltransferase
MTLKERDQMSTGGSKTTSLASRSVYIDTIKGILIILVVFGHFLETTFECPIDCLIRNIIYSFHMPLFVFLSGYLTPSEDDRIIRGIKKAAILYIVFQTIELILHGDFSIRGFLTPYWHLWYIWCVLFWRIGIYFFKGYLTNKTIIIASCFIVGFAIGFVPRNSTLAIQRIFAFLPYFMLGYFSKGKQLKEGISKLDIKWFILCLLCLVPIMIYKGQNYFFILTNSMSFEWSKLNMFGRISAYIIGISFSVIILRFTKENNILSKIGKDSLIIYLLHAEFVLIVRYFQVLPRNPFMYIIYTIVTITVLMLLSYCLNKIKWGRIKSIF